MPESNEKQRIMRLYDQSARVYDTQYKDEQDAKIRTALHNLTLKENDLILDAGCGTGLLFRHVADKVQFLAGIDVSSSLLKEAAKKARNRNNIALIQADADAMPFSDRTFDKVFALTLLQNMPDSGKTLDEIKRVSKLNADIVLSGLRKAFTEEQFSELLKRAGFQINMLKLDEQMREYISVCSKTVR
jgi:ubiquinone/menaquinone biosynthesis C-methylase UbiE